MIIRPRERAAHLQDGNKLETEYGFWQVRDTLVYASYS